MRRNLFFVILLILPLYSCFAQDTENEILNWTSRNRISGNKLIRTDTIVLQINSRSGDYDADIVLPYTNKDNLSIGDAWIEDKYGNVVRKLNKNEIKTRNAISGFSLYEDNFIKTFQLKYNIYPYKIVYSFQITYSDFFILFSWNPQYGRQLNINRFKISVEVPPNYPVKYRQRAVNEPQINKGETAVQYVWTGSYKSAKKEIEAGESERQPEITVLPLMFKYGEKGSWESWTSFGDWIVTLNRNMDVLPPNEKQNIDRLLSGITDKREKIRILYNYLQKYTHYINVKIDIGGLKSYPASYVSSNKYGDCKALSNYMKSMLAYAGIPAYYTLIYGGYRSENIDKSFPNQVFNHIIVTVPLDNDTIFLECTDKNIPCGYVGTFIQDRDAFMIIPGGSRFIKTPALTCDNVLSKRVIRIDEANNAEIEMVCRGEEYEKINYLFREDDKEQTDKYVQTRILSDISSNVVAWKISESKNEQPEITLKANARLQNPVKKYGNNWVLPNFSHELPAFEIPEKRTEEVRIHFPIFLQDSIYYKLGVDSQFRLPDSVAIHTKYGSYTIKYKMTDDNNMLITKEMLIQSGKYTLDEYADFYNFISNIKNTEKKNIYVEINK
jgi:hypothetical protein